MTTTLINRPPLPIVAFIILFVNLGSVPNVDAQTGYYPYVIARGEDRQILRNMPIEERPTRPMHFYGNAVRRSYYGTSMNLFPRNNFNGSLLAPRNTLPVQRGRLFGRRGR